MFMAAYDREDADAYEQHVVRVARKWLAILNSPQTSQGVVDKLLDDILIETPPDYGCAWDDLKKHIVMWAVREEWLDPDEL